MKTTYRVTGTLISASAGTGKTYQLALRFVALLCLGVDAASIVALTFTRKAAGEFRDRILSRLAEGAESPDKANALAEAVRGLWNGENGLPALLEEGTPPESTPMGQAEDLQQYFCDLLKKMVDRFSQLQLCTMDSFFTRLVNLHAEDLGTSTPAVIMGAAEQEAREHAIHALCREIEEEGDEAVRCFLDNFRTASPKSPVDPVGTIRELLKEYHDLYLQNCNEQPWNNPPADLPEEAIRPLTSEELDGFEEQICDLSSRKEDRLGLGENSIRNITVKVREHKFDKTRDTVINAISKPENRGKRLAQIVNQLYRREQLDALYHAQQQTRAIFALMERFEQCYEREVRSRGLFTTNDYTQKAMQLISDSDSLNDLTFRLDNKIMHWMLDEFQDTSRMQWMALSPILNNIVEQRETPDQKALDHSIFIVGDDKQSIYGWRNATPEIFRRLRSGNTPLSEYLQKAQLTVNRRSTQEVLDFANLVFAKEDRRFWPQAEAYNKKQHGYVCMRRLPRGNTGKEALWERTVDIICRLPIREKRMSVGILCRGNTECEAIYRLLRSHCPELPSILINDILIGTDSPLGQTLRALFKWLGHPLDTYCQSVVNASPLHDYATEEQYRRMLTIVEEQGYAALMNDIERHLNNQNLRLSTFQGERLRDWLTAAAQFDADGGGTIDEWLNFIEQLTRKENPPRACVQVSTMHKSKGLEYDVVILPFKSGTRIGYTESKDVTPDDINVITGRAGSEPESGLSNLFVPPADTKLLFCKASPELRYMLQEEIEKHVTDNKNLLYVALTRARYATYIFLDDAYRKSNSALTDESNHKRLQMAIEAPEIREAMEQDEEVLMYETPGGNREWYRDIDFEERTEAETKERGPLPVSVPRRKRLRPSTHEDAPNQADRKSAGVGRTEALAFGTRVHACLEQVLSWQGEESAPSWYRKPSDEAEQAAARALKTPAIRSFFELSPGDCAFNEQPLESVSGCEWVSGVIDRFVLRADGRVQIIDYKTDANPDTLDRYREQMNCYRRMLAAALERPEEAVSVTLISIPRSGEPSVITAIA